MSSSSISEVISVWDGGFYFCNQQDFVSTDLQSAARHAIFFDRRARSEIWRHRITFFPDATIAEEFLGEEERR